MAWTWKSEPELIGRLTAAQNHPAHKDIDIMSIAGLFGSRDQLVRHVERCEQWVSSYVAPVRRRRAA